MDDEDGPEGFDPAAASRRRWRRIGVIIAGIFAVGGLLVVAYVVLILVSLNNWASNK